MQHMPKERERLLLKALDKAADHTSAGMGSNESIAKSAVEHNLTLQETRRVVESYNKAKSVAFMKEASADERSSEFELADYNKVLDMMDAGSKTASEEPSFEMPRVDFSAMAYQAPMDKSASETVPFAKHAGESPSEMSVANELEKWASVIMHLHNSVNDLSKQASWRADHSVRDLVQEIELGVRGEELDKLACVMADAYGEEKAGRFISYLNARIKGVKIPEGVRKVAHAAVMPDTRLYKLLEKSASACFERDTLAKGVKWVDSFLGIGKTAAEGEEGGAVKGTGMTDSLGNILSGVVGLPLPDTRNKSTMDPKTGLFPSMLARKKVLDSVEAFTDMYLNNKDIQGYPLEDVYSAYKNIVDTTPELAQKGKWLESSVLRQLAQGGKVDPFEVRDMISAESTLHQGEAMRNRGMSDYITHTKNYHDRYSGDNKGAPRR